MTFLEKINETYENRIKAEENVKVAVKDAILRYAQNFGWENKRAYLTESEFKYLLLESRSGWTKCQSVDELNFLEVMGAAEFIVNFLNREGFTVITTCSSYGIQFEIRWEKN